MPRQKDKGLEAYDYNDLDRNQLINKGQYGYVFRANKKSN